MPSTPKSPGRPRSTIVGQPSPLAKVATARTPTKLQAPAGAVSALAAAASPRDIARRFEEMTGERDAATSSGGSGGTAAAGGTKPKKAWTPTAVQTLCVSCSKPVFFQERQEVDGKIYHKACMRCRQCETQLSLGSYAAFDGVLYCKPHYKQRFLRKVPLPCIATRMQADLIAVAA